jgi:hypothetical protein
VSTKPSASPIRVDPEIAAASTSGAATAGLKEAKDVIDGLRGDLGLTRRR